MAQWQRPLAPALVAAGLAALELAALVAAWRLPFGAGHGLETRISLAAAHAILVVGGGLTAVAALAGIHRALARFRPVAAAIACLALFPVALIGLASVYGSLLLAGLL